MSEEARHLIGGWATDSLSQAERRHLLSAALDDQDLFETLVEEDGLRELLADTAARERVLAGLDRPSLRERWRAFFVRPATLADLLAATTVLAVALASLLLYRGAPPPEGVAARPVPRPVSPSTLERLAALPARQAVPASLEIEGAGAGTSVRGGAMLSLRLTLPAPARVLLVAARPDGSLVQAWPGPGQAPALLAAAGPVTLRVQLAVPSLPGRHRLRLVVAPADLDMAAVAPGDVHRHSPLLTLVDLPFEVERP